MKSPLISVIVPIYNRESFLPKCIESIISQSYQNIEIILVDDGSTDKSLELCNQFAAKDSRITVIHIENSGVSNARNQGLSSAHGEYIQFVDSDDFIDSQMLNEYVKRLNGTPNLDLIICGFKNVSKTGNLEYLEISEKEISSIDDFLENFGLLLDFNLLRSPVNKLYKKAILDNNKIKFDTSTQIAEDALFNIAYYKIINSILIVKEPFYNCVNHSSAGRLTISYHTSFFGSQRKYFSELVDFLKSNNAFIQNNRHIVIKQYSSLITTGLERIVKTCKKSPQKKIKEAREYIIENLIFDILNETNINHYNKRNCFLLYKKRYFTLSCYINNRYNIKRYRALFLGYKLKYFVLSVLAVLDAPISFLYTLFNW